MESIGPENLQQVSLPAINKEDNCQSLQGYQLPASSQSGIISLPAINKEDNCQSFQGYQLPAFSQSGIVSLPAFSKTTSL